MISNKYVLTMREMYRISSDNMFLYDRLYNQAQQSVSRPSHSSKYE